MNTLIISDIHLGGDVSQAKLLCKFLHGIEGSTQRLIINGDLFDGGDFRRLTKWHWHALSIFRRLSNHLDVVYIRGNHDLPANLMSHLLGVCVVEDYEFVSGDKRILVMHGHVFDDYLINHPIMVWFGDVLYYFLQKIDSRHYISHKIKHNSKHYLQCIEMVKRKALELAKSRLCDVVCCGHSHFAESAGDDSTRYYNSGCWTELPCTYLEVLDGVVTIKEYGKK